MTNFDKMVNWLEEQGFDFLKDTAGETWSVIYINGYVVEFENETSRIFVTNSFIEIVKEYKKPIMAVKSCLK